jgi:hypothetical protein
LLNFYQANLSLQKEQKKKEKEEEEGNSSISNLVVCTYL